MGLSIAFKKNGLMLWMPLKSISVYICGLEVEEETGTNILSYLEEHPEFTVFFAPGPRITLLDPKLLERVFALHPILHLNQKEITSYTGKEELKAAAEEIYRFTQNTVIVTLGADGCYYYDGEKEETIPGYRQNSWIPLEPGTRISVR